MTTDARGREFAHRHYRRIVSLVPSWTESLFVLGAGDRVVAITDYRAEPQAAVANLQRIGGTKHLSWYGVRIGASPSITKTDKWLENGRTLMDTMPG